MTWLREIRARMKLAAGGKPLPTVLMYHSVGDNGAHFNVTPQAFAVQMDFLEKNGFQVVPLEACVRRTKTGETGKLVALTFDDGCKDFIANALPVLKTHGFPATVFLITGKMGGGYTPSDGGSIPLMSWAEAGDLLRAPGIELGSHAVSHQKLIKLSADGQRKEMAASREALVRQLGCEGGLWLSYPYGRNDETTRRIAREEGYAGAVTIEPGHPGAATDPFGVPRMYVHSEMGMKEFEALFA